MTALRTVLAGFVLAAMPAFADGNDAPPPLSVWQTAPDRTAQNPQSGWNCPAEVGGFQRTRFTAYNTSGTDVSCNYVDANHVVVTIYLTRRDGGRSLAEDFAEAKRELLQYAPDAVPLPAAEQKTIAGDLGWTSLIYSEKDGTNRSGIWMADVSGWTLEFRTDYEPADEQQAFDEMALLTKDAVDTAGAHLSRCAKSEIPARDGIAVTDKDAIMQDVIVFAASLQVDAGAGKDSLPSEQPPAEWCAEDLVADLQVPVLMWHGLDAKSAAASWDRATLMTIGEPPAVLSRPSLVIALVRKSESQGKDAALAYALTLDDGEETLILGFFTGRPSASALGKPLEDAAQHHLQPLAGVDRKGGKITIYMPSDKTKTD